MVLWTIAIIMTVIFLFLLLLIWLRKVQFDAIHQKNREGNFLLADLVQECVLQILRSLRHFVFVLRMFGLPYLHWPSVAALIVIGRKQFVQANRT